MSVKKILVATDFSESSNQALRFAAVLARKYGAEILLTHIFTCVDEFGRVDKASKAYRAERLAAGHAVAEVLASGVLDGIWHEAFCAEGFFWQTLDGLIRQKRISLVALGTSGARDTQADCMGSHAELAFRNADCPVLTAGPAAKANPKPIKRVLFATDFGQGARRAVKWAYTLAQDFRADLKLLYVSGGADSSFQPQSHIVDETTRVRLLETIPADISAVCDIECVVRRGDPAEEIVSFAAQSAADLIVMGTRSGRPAASHLPLTTAYMVAVNAPCPLLTIRS